MAGLISATLFFVFIVGAGFICGRALGSSILFNVPNTQLLNDLVLIIGYAAPWAVLAPQLPRLVRNWRSQLQQIHNAIRG
jgi:hypothetical protein